jgi:phosphoribosylamine---glycine ligase
MKKILLIGSGGREHAIGEAIKRSHQENNLIVYGNLVNIGLSKLSSRYEVGDLSDVKRIVEIAYEENIDFAIIGPEGPINAGVSDALIHARIPCVSPSSNTGRLETSKSFARRLLNQYSIPGNPVFKSFNDLERIRDFIENNLGGSFVIKADGLKSGKGVFVMGDHFETIEDGLKIAENIINSDGSVLIEERFIGQEFSLMFFVDGKTIKKMPLVQDNKRAFEDDKGPNTGGMGSYSMENHLLPFITKEDVLFATSITQQIVDIIPKECGEYYKGILYGSFIKTRTGIKVIEYNVRFGDPESLNVLPILKTDFIKICEGIIAGTLHLIPVEFSNFATVCKYIVPKGYPDNPLSDVKIELENINEDINVYYSSIEKRDNDYYLMGSRAIAMVGIGINLRKAELLAEEGCWRVKGPVFYRKDIGTKEYIEKKIEMMNRLMS